MIEKFRNKLDEVEWDDADSIIDFLRENVLYLRNLESSANPELLSEILNLKLDYIFALNRKKYFSSAYEYLREVDILLQKTRKTEYFDRYNERYKFAFEIITHNMKEYEESQMYFSELIKIDPENDQYKDWYYGNYTMIFSKKIKYSYICRSSNICFSCVLRLVCIFRFRNKAVA